MRNNIVTVEYNGGCYIRTPELVQYDYGQILHLVGFGLPSAFQVDFGTSRIAGETVQVIGALDYVSIPDTLLQGSANIYAFIRLHTGEDDGETVYVIELPVMARPEITGEEPTPVEQDLIDQLMAALSAGVAAAEAAAAQIEGMSAEAETLPAGSPATAAWDAEHGKLLLGIPKGDTGAAGAEGPEGPAGSDGYSPIVTVEEITGGHRVTITDAEGDHAFDVMDGQGGQGSDDVFVATYGTTTNAEIEAALSAGQTVFCKLTNSGVDYYLPLTRVEDASTHRFASQNITETGVRTVGALCSSNVWSSRSYRTMIAPANPSAGDVPMYDGSLWEPKALTASDVGALPDSTTIPEAATATPSDLGTAAVGTSSKYAKEDHVHNKPTYTKSDVGLGNVDNVQQYSANNPPPYPVTSVNGSTGAVSLSIPSSASDVGAVAVAQGVSHAGEFLVVGSNGNVTTVTLSTWQGGNY